MAVQPPLAFVSANAEPPGLQIVVNFGVFAGREATAAELDQLAARALEIVERVSVVAEDRHEVGDRVEAALHQVRLEVAADLVPAGDEATQLAERLLAVATEWGEGCIAARHADVTEL